MVIRAVFRCAKLPLASFVGGHFIAGFLKGSYNILQQQHENEKKRLLDKTAFLHLSNFCVLGIYTFLTRKQPINISYTGFPWRKLPVALLLGMGSMCAFRKLLESTKEKIEFPIEHYLDEVEHAETSSPYSYYSAISGTIPITEEVLFRGILFGSLVKSISAPAAVLISSSVFGCLHERGQVAIIIFGAGMAWMYHILERHPLALSIPIAFHVYNNYSYQSKFAAYAPKNITNDKYKNMRHTIYKSGDKEAIESWYNSLLMNQRYGDVCRAILLKEMKGQF